MLTAENNDSAHYIITQEGDLVVQAHTFTNANYSQFQPEHSGHNYQPNPSQLISIAHPLFLSALQFAFGKKYLAAQQILEKEQRQQEYETQKLQINHVHEEHMEALKILFKLSQSAQNQHEREMILRLLEAYLKREFLFQEEQPTQ